MHGESRLDSDQWYEKVVAGELTTRNSADPFNIRPKSGRLEIWRHFFSIRVGNNWNKIPAEMKIEHWPASKLSTANTETE
jgi:hypothetical protein